MLLIWARYIRNLYFATLLFPDIIFVKGKVECTLVQALRLCTGRMAYRGVEV
jgi:hypothetical protein